MVTSVRQLVVLLFAVAMATLALAFHADASARNKCSKSGDRVLSSSDGMEFIARKKPRKGWRDGPTTIYACSFKYGRRILLMEAGTKDTLIRKFSAHQGNSRYAAFVSRYASTIDKKYGLDTRIHVMDLKTAKQKSESSPHSSWRTTGTYVTALALNAQGWIGWISYAFDIGIDPELPQGSWETEVHFRGPEGPRVLARGNKIDRNHIAFDTAGTGLVWAENVPSAPAQ